jgi:hypothetical protein
MKGKVVKKGNDWFFEFIEKFLVKNPKKTLLRRKNKVYVKRQLPVHPDSYSLCVENKLMKGEILTIGSGETEMDVVDIDVVKLLK